MIGFGGSCNWFFRTLGSWIYLQDTSESSHYTMQDTRCHEMFVVIVTLTCMLICLLDQAHLVETNHQVGLIICVVCGILGNILSFMLTVLSLNVAGCSNSKQEGKT